MGKEELFLKWQQLCLDDRKMAELALQNGLWLQSAFHFQQALEKILKAYIVLHLNEDPPYTHDLVRLASVLEVKFQTAKQISRRVSDLNPYYITARYPSYRENIAKGLTKEKLDEFRTLLEEVLQWHEAKQT